MGRKLFCYYIYIRALLLTTTSEAEPYWLFVSFSILFLLTMNPYMGSEGVVAIENTWIKANNGAALVAQEIVTHQIHYMPIILWGAIKDKENITHKFAAGFSMIICLFEGTYNSGSRYKIIKESQY